VANYGSNTVSIIDTLTNNVTSTVNVGMEPAEVAVTPDGTKVYVTNYWDNTVSVIDTVTNTVIDTVNVEERPIGVAVIQERKMHFCSWFFIGYLQLQRKHH
jgi:YVTN family beta-propeller protein